jgi:hypothetical protein
MRRRERCQATAFARIVATVGACSHPGDRQQRANLFIVHGGLSVG